MIVLKTDALQGNCTYSTTTLIRERTAITEPLLRLLPSLNLLAFVAGNPTNVINSEVLEHPQVRDFIQQGSQD